MDELLTDSNFRRLVLEKLGMSQSIEGMEEGLRIVDKMGAFLKAAEVIEKERKAKEHEMNLKARLLRALEARKEQVKPTPNDIQRIAQEVADAISDKMDASIYDRRKLPYQEYLLKEAQPAVVMNHQSMEAQGFKVVPNVRVPNDVRIHEGDLHVTGDMIVTGDIVVEGDMRAENLKVEGNVEVTGPKLVVPPKIIQAPPRHGKSMLPHKLIGLADPNPDPLTFNGVELKYDLRFGEIQKKLQQELNDQRRNG